MLTDLRLAWRMFLRGRGASLLTVAMLGVAIAGTLTLFTVLTAFITLWPDLPERERLARIYAANPRLGAERTPIPLASFAQWAPQLATLETVAAFVSDDRPLDAGPDVSVQAVTAGYFEVFGVQPIAGRTPKGTDADTRARTAVLSEPLARLKFGTPADAIGRSLTLHSDRYTITGVMPRGFYFPMPAAQVWIPIAAEAPRDWRVTGIGRLRAGKKWSEAAAELSAIAQQGNGSAAAVGWTIRPIPLDEDQWLRTRNGLIGVLGPALIVLLIACVNATNLMLARGVERDGEFAVRLALGASRGRIVRQLVVEGAVVAVVAAGAGATLSVWGIRVFRSIISGFSTPTADRLAFTSSTLLATSAIAIAMPIVVSALPAIGASRRRLPSALTAVARSGRGGGLYGPRDALVFVEVALASVLVVMALMMFRLFGELQRIRPSYDPAPVVVAEVQGDLKAADLITMLERARAVPGVVAVATTNSPGSLLPIERASGSVASMSGKEIFVSCSVAEVSPDYFHTLQLPIVAGRPFDKDVVPASGVAIASVTLAERLWSGRRLPAGRVTLSTGGRVRQLEIIGVAADALAPNRLGFNGGVLYVPRDPDTAGSVILLVRTAGQASSIVGPLSHTLSAVGARHRLRVRPLAEAVGYNPRDRSLSLGLLAMFGTLALGLAAGGIFAVSRHSVLQRTREFGIRLALGATRGALIRMVMGRDMKLVGSAVVVAAGGTLAVTYFAFFEMLRVALSDARFWIGILVALGGVSTFACFVAAHRISRMEPMDALRDL